VAEDAVRGGGDEMNATHHRVGFGVAAGDFEIRHLPEVLVFEPDDDARFIAHGNARQRPLAITTDPDRLVLDAGTFGPEVTRPTATRLKQQSVAGLQKRLIRS